MSRFDSWCQARVDWFVHELMYRCECPRVSVLYWIEAVKVLSLFVLGAISTSLWRWPTIVCALLLGVMMHWPPDSLVRRAAPPAWIRFVVWVFVALDVSTIWAPPAVRTTAQAVFSLAFDLSALLSFYAAGSSDDPPRRRRRVRESALVPMRAES